MPVNPLDTARPIAHPDAVVQGDQYRITVLTDGLVRLEWSDTGEFEDRSSAFALTRELPVPEFRVIESDDVLEIVTDRFRLTYDRGPFSPHGLTAHVVGNISTWHSTWRFGEEQEGNLGGTARTLDMVDGPVDIGTGIMSKNGYAVVDDSASFLFTDDGWVAPRTGGGLDLYLFCYGHDYRGALDALYRVSGKTPLLPRFALGNWWSRYFRYSEQTYRELIERFEREGIPFSVSVVDMDWHRVEDVPAKYGSGWTGYSWNRELFPDPEAFMAWLHEQGLRITLNVHPADGIRGFEDSYPEIARAMGIDPASDEPVQFDVTNPEFIRAYLDLVHHPLEAEGVNFWWLDWQQGTFSRGGVDPLWILNHFHYIDSGRDGTRPLTFSRYAGIGSHRYPLGFSGDTVISWASLDFQPYFTSTASNVGYGWWSHDIGGHLFGTFDDELATRWVQLGVFSPIMRLHSSNNEFSGKEPWNFDAENREVMGEFLRLRHRLVPYLHTANYRASTEALPLVQPMYYAYPEAAEAYRVRNEYLFGDQLVVAPITTPADPVTKRASVTAWIPDGTWIDFFTGAVYEGPGMRELFRALGEMPVLAKAGGIVPMTSEISNSVDDNPAHIEVRIFAGADGEFTLREENGEGTGENADQWAATRIRLDWHNGSIDIDGASGNLACLPRTRDWTIVLDAFDDDADLAVTAGGRPLDAEITRDDSRGITVRLTGVPVESGIRIESKNGFRMRPARVEARAHDLVSRARIAYEQKADIMRIIRSNRSAAQTVAQLAAMNPSESLFGALTEIVTDDAPR